MLLERGKKSEFSLELSLELSIKFSFFHGVLTGRGMKEKSQISSIKILKVINSVGWGFFKVNFSGRELNSQKVMLSSVTMSYKNLHLLSRGGSRLLAWFLYLGPLLF